MNELDAEFMGMFHRMTKAQQERFLIAGRETEREYARMMESVDSEKERYRLQKVREICRRAGVCAKS